MIAKRAEKTAVIAIINLPFPEWLQDFNNARFGNAILDRLTDPADTIETVAEPFRFRRTLG